MWNDAEGEPEQESESETDETRLHSPDYNQTGDIYVAESRHTILQVSDGIFAGGA